MKFKSLGTILLVPSIMFATIANANDIATATTAYEKANKTGFMWTVTSKAFKAMGEAKKAGESEKVTKLAKIVILQSTQIIKQAKDNASVAPRL